MTSRVLFACWPFEGHVFPQLSMALALRERGADVAFYTDDLARELIEGEGFEVFPFKRVGPKWRRVHEGAQGSGGRRDAIRLLRESREWIVGTIADQVADIEDVTADWRPDVIGAEASMWGPLLVLSERSPVPVALVSPLITAQLPGPDAPAAGGLARAGTPRAQRINRIAERLTAVAAHGPRRSDAPSPPPAGGCRCISSSALRSSTTTGATCRRASTTSARACGTRASRTERANGSTVSRPAAPGCTSPRARPISSSRCSSAPPPVASRGRRARRS
jgi:hypothetical protein